MKFGVVVFPGSNCDYDCYYVVRDLLGEEVDFIWHKETRVEGFDCLILPGGFSYGDYLRTGAIALLDSFRFGHLGNGRNRYLFSGVVGGIAAYGNCTGIPTVGGEVYFDETYEGNPLVNVMCVGMARGDNLVKARANGVGNPVLYVGADTGRDGLEGASFDFQKV